MDFGTMAACGLALSETQSKRKEDEKARKKTPKKEKSPIKQPESIGDSPLRYKEIADVFKEMI
jgi:hypothetical protein